MGDAARKLRCSSAVFVVLGCGLPGQTPPATCTVEGYLTETITGAPIADATITAASGLRRNSAKTEANGHFIFHDLPPGNYSFLPSKDGYEPGSGRRQTLTASTALQRVDLQLNDGAALSGRVLDEDRNPVPHVALSLLMRVPVNGRSIPVHFAANSDDAGEYRFEHLSPGQYFVFAQAPPAPKRSPKPEAELVTTFYPDASSIETAVPISLRPGERHGGVDIRLRKLPAYCARGSLLAEDAALSATLTISQAAAAGLADIIGPVNIDKTGAFEVCGLAPGVWSARTPPLQVGGEIGRHFEANFEISNHDVDLGALAALHSYTVHGTVSVDGARSDDPLPLGTTIETDLFVGSQALRAVSPLSRNGSFMLPTRFSDPYWLSVKTLPGYYLQRVTTGGQGGMGQPITPSPADVQIVLGSDGAMVSGKAVDKDNQPVAEAAVILAPAQLPQQGAPGLIQMAQSDQNGGFTFQTVAPGDYLLLAFSVSPKGDGEDPDFVRAHSGDATRLSLQSRDRQSVAVTVR